MLTSREGSQGGRGKWIVAAIAFAIPWCVVAARSLQILPEGNGRLADTDPTRRLSQWHESQVPQPAALFVTWEGSTCDDPRVVLFTENLVGRDDADGIRRGGAPEIAKVTTAADMLGRLVAQGLDADTAVTRLTGTFIGAGGLKLRLTAAGRETRDATTARLVRAARENLGIELQTRGPVETVTGQNEAAEGGAPAVAVAVPEHDVEITWSGFHPQSTTFAQVRALATGLTDFATADEPHGRKLVEECFVAPGSPAGIEIELSAAGVADVPAALRAIDRAAAAAEIDDVAVIGQPIDQWEQSRAVSNVFWNPTAPAMKLSQRSLPLLLAIVAAAMTCLAVRSVRKGLMLFALAGVGTLMSLALLRITGAKIDPVLLAVPLYAGLLVLANGVHVVSTRVDSEADDELLTREKIRRQNALIVAALVMLPLGISSTPVVRQVGMLGAAGALLALLLDTFVLPLLMPMTGAERVRGRAEDGPWSTIGKMIAARPRVVGLLCSALLIAGACGLAKLRIQSSDLPLRPIDSRITSATRFVEDNLTGAAPLDVIVRFQSDSLTRLRFVERAEVVRAAELAIQRHPAVAGTFSLADLLPVTELPAADAPTRQRVMFARRSNEVEERVRSGEIAGVDTLLFTAEAAADWQVAGDERLSSKGDELWRISTRAKLPAGVDVPRVASEIDASIQEVLREHPGADHVMAATPVKAAATRTVMLRSQSKTFLLASVLMIGALIWMLRSPTAILVGLVSNVLPIAAVLGVAAQRGLRLDVDVMLAALLGLGLAAQASVRMLVSLREGIQAGEPHIAAMQRALRETARQNWRFAMVSIAGALVLATSQVGSLATFGKLLAAMIGATQLTGTFLLPAMLAGRVGRWLESSLRVAEPAIAVTQEVIQSPHVRFEPAARDAVRPAV